MATSNTSTSSTATNLLSSDISRRNPQDEYELIQKIGSGTYGDVYKVRINHMLNEVRNFKSFIFIYSTRQSEFKVMS